MQHQLWGCILGPEQCCSTGRTAVKAKEEALLERVQHVEVVGLILQRWTLAEQIHQSLAVHVPGCIRRKARLSSDRGLGGEKERHACGAALLDCAQEGPLNVSIMTLAHTTGIPMLPETAPKELMDPCEFMTTKPRRFKGLPQTPPTGPNVPVCTSLVWGGLGYKRQGLFLPPAASVMWPSCVCVDPKSWQFCCPADIISFPA